MIGLLFFVDLIVVDVIIIMKILIIIMIINNFKCSNVFSNMISSVFE